MLYSAIHGDEDKKPMANPRDEEQFFKDFKDMMENNGQKIGPNGWN
jgi:hypothetical protein